MEYRRVGLRIRASVVGVVASGLLAAGVLVSCQTYTPPPGQWTPADREPARSAAPDRSPSRTSPAKPIDAADREAILAKKRGPRLTDITTEPVIRIRIQQATSSVTLQASGQLALGPAGQTHRFAAPLTVRRKDGAFVLRDGQGEHFRWQIDAIPVASLAGQMQIGQARYPGELKLVADGASRFDVINHLPLEDYLPGVIERELYASWHPETFRTQAVAARSYALWERTLRDRAAFDLEATQASQVYGGAAKNPKAIAAVRDTRGQVVSYGGRVLPAFFSATSGGTGQDAALAFPGRVENLPPLRGRDRGNWGAGSSKYRWGPFDRSSHTLARRIAAWGKANRDPVAGLSGLRAIRVGSANQAGRPATFILTDGRGKAFTLPAESFRFACNYAANGLPKLTSATKLYSSHVRVTVAGATVRFSDGRGFGHGVGLDQWGAEGMAKAGYSYRSILTYFYPGAQLVKAY